MTPTGMILAAGFGTRLRPLTNELPKPLVPVGDRSVLAHAADNLRAMGVSRVVVNTHHLADCYDERELSTRLEMEVSLEHEPHILGTAGGIRNAAAHFGNADVVVHNGDILAELDAAALLAHHREQEALATLALRTGAPKGEGPVGLDEAGDIVRLRDQRFGDEHEGAEFIGVHIVSAALRKHLPAEGCMVGDVYIPALRAGKRIVGAGVVRRFTDVGTPRAYLDANLHWLGDLSHHTGRGAEVGSEVSLERSVIGAGAQVSGRGRLERCVVWPGAKAQAPLSDAIVTTAGKVVQEIAPDGG